jgi:hypothetical protein
MVFGSDSGFGIILVEEENYNTPTMHALHFTITAKELYQAETARSTDLNNGRKTKLKFYHFTPQGLNTCIGRMKKIFKRSCIHLPKGRRDVNDEIHQIGKQERQRRRDERNSCCSIFWRPSESFRREDE